MYPRQDERSGLYGYWDRDSWAIHPQFGYARRFNGGYAAVELVDKTPCLIGIDGNFHPLKAICGNKTPILDEHHSFTGFGGYESQPPRYARVWTDHGGRREWGLIDSSLNYRPLLHEAFKAVTIVRPCAEHVVLFHATGRRNEPVCGLFNLGDMQLELPVEYSCIYPSNESIWVVSRTTGKHREIHHHAFYDVSKREFLPGSFPFALPFSCGFGAVRVGEWNLEGRSYFVDKNLRPAFDAEFDDLGPFSHGLAAVYQGDDAGYIDTTGQMRLLLPYAELQPFNEFGLAIANRDDAEWDIDIIDREGRPRLTGLETADYWQGDFPHFEVSKNGKDLLYDINLNLIF